MSTRAALYLIAAASVLTFLGVVFVAGCPPAERLGPELEERLYLERIESAGYRAGERGEPAEANPHLPGDEWGAWERGRARAERVRR